MYYPSFTIFQEQACQGNLIPVYSEILADTETPVSVLMKLHTQPYPFLLESVEGGEKWARYTFIGTDPHIIFKVKGDEIIVQERTRIKHFKHHGDPLAFLKVLVHQYRPVQMEGLPRFYGGAVGFLGYEMVRFFEKLPDKTQKGHSTDDAVFLITDTLIIFDNVRHTIKVVTSLFTEGKNDLRALYNEGTKKIDGIINILKAPDKPQEGPSRSDNIISFSPNITRESYLDAVKKARDYIVSGDIIQVVLSQRFQASVEIDPVHLYRALRFINPSPYLFYLKLDELILIGSSPEVMVRLEEGTVELRPIAGTRRRGKNEQEDRMLADELLQDPKEKAEHIMLVDLGRNDLGRIARTGTVQVTQLMFLERYSHVMHLVSNIQAQLDKEKDCFDVLKATFPAGTLTGAPKIRAMEIINELEVERRGPYGGAVGFFSYSGNMDFCITIRTMVVKNGIVYVQAGAGIVADSNPESEYQETLNKAEGIRQAVQMAASGLTIKDPRGGKNDLGDR